jgi:hypothetical protein
VFGRNGRHDEQLAWMSSKLSRILLVTVFVGFLGAGAVARWSIGSIKQSASWNTDQFEPTGAQLLNSFA